MTVVDELLVQTIEQLLADGCDPATVVAVEGASGFDATLWATLEDSGFTKVLVPADAGGSGGTLHDVAALSKAAGRHAAPVPLADSNLAACVLATAGLAVPDGPLGLVIGGEVRDGLLSGVAIRVPWAPVASTFAVVATSTQDGSAVTASVPASQVKVGSPTRNYAGEPRADVHIDGVRVSGGASSGFSVESARSSAALSRALLMSGALQKAVDLSVQYAMEREQFGRPIGRYQVLQHYLAEMAGEAAAAEAAVDNAVDAVLSSPFESHVLAIAGAKAVCGRAVGIINRLAHQLHGAIGFTDEHRLQLTTRRLWSWRDEYGTESMWAASLGHRLVADGGAALWPRMTTWPSAT